LAGAFIASETLPALKVRRRWPAAGWAPSPARSAGSRLACGWGCARTGQRAGIAAAALTGAAVLVVAGFVAVAFA
jgi:hypothetical protein